MQLIATDGFACAMIIAKLIWLWEIKSSRLNIESNVGNTMKNNNRLKIMDIYIENKRLAMEYQMTRVVINKILADAKERRSEAGHLISCHVENN